QGLRTCTLSGFLGLRSKTADMEEMLEEGQCRVETKVGAGGPHQGSPVAPDKSRQSQGHFQLSAPGSFRAAARHPSLAARDTLGGPQERHDAIGQLTGELDRGGSKRAQVDRDVVDGGLLR